MTSNAETLSSDDERGHWDDAWHDRDPASTSWFEGDAPIGTDIILGDGDVPPSVVDVGAGQSTLVDRLLAAGVGHVTLLDIAVEPLAVTGARLGERDDVTYVISDIRTWTPHRTFACWHDRATFHFLGAAADQRAYATVAASAVEPGGRLIVGTFATDGPEACSGLPVVRRDRAGLAAAFAADFDLDHTVDHTHVTPWGAEQLFLYGVFRRR